MDYFFIDSHIHLDMKIFDSDREEVIKKSFENNVKYFLNVGYDFKSSINSNRLSQINKFIFASIGFHPHDAKDFKEEYLLKFERLIKENKKIIAIGEIGLDYYRNLSPKEIQIEIFKKQIEFAIDLNLPIIIHERDSFWDTIEIINNYKGRIKGVFHCFSGDISKIKEIIKLDFYVGIGGTITYPKNNILRETIKRAPLERILLETDAPYLPPQNFRGKRNEPKFLIYTAEYLAKLINIPLEKLSEITNKNFSELFKINF
ncbi:MAG: TatD family hydrolase [Caldisericia bacterium]|nr:TatD family hydrolase [Caldisericia bacterium]